MKAGLAWVLVGAAAAVQAQDLPALNRQVQVHVLPKPGAVLNGPEAEAYRRFFGQAPRAARPAEPDGGDEPVRRHARPKQPAGMGVLWRDGQHVLTLAQLHEGPEVQAFAVETEAGQRVEATLVGSDQLSDASLLKLARPLAAAPCNFGGAQGVVVGQEVYAIGNLALLQRSLQRGIVSAVGREFIQAHHAPHLQLDFRSAQGMAGGPVFDAQGRVVALNAGLFSNGGRDVAALATPVDDLLLAAEALASGQARRMSRVGVRLSDEDADDWQTWLKGGSGVRIEAVDEAGPAARAGVTVSDLVLAMNGQAVRTHAELTRWVARLPVATESVWQVQRKGQALTLRVVPEPAPSAP
jgi:S1-C subfamily serine protease